MTTRAAAAANHREVVEGFSRRVVGVPAGGWDAPSPAEGWRARDVVRHLVTWLPGFLEGGSDVRLDPVPSVDDDPPAAWQAHAEQVQALLDDPGTDGRSYSSSFTGDMPLAQAIDRSTQGGSSAVNPELHRR